MSGSDEIEALDASIFQILDGLWFLEVERQVGFDKALEIDKNVWRLFSQKEAQRLVKFYTENGSITKLDSPVMVLEKLLPKAMFNKTLKFKIETNGSDELVLIVSECKTLVGMRKVGRPEQQASIVCHDMGFIFYDEFARAIDPAFAVSCTFTPYEGLQRGGQGGLCGWRFTIGKRQ